MFFILFTMYVTFTQSVCLRNDADNDDDVQIDMKIFTYTDTHTMESLYKHFYYYFIFNCKSVLNWPMNGIEPNGWCYWFNPFCWLFMFIDQENSFIMPHKLWATNNTMLFTVKFQNDGHIFVHCMLLCRQQKVIWILITLVHLFINLFSASFNYQCL